MLQLTDFHSRLICQLLFTCSLCKNYPPLRSSNSKQKEGSSAATILLADSGLDTQTAGGLTVFIPQEDRQGVVTGWLWLFDSTAARL